MKRNNIIQLIDKVKQDMKIIPAFIDGKTIEGKFYWYEVIRKCLTQIDKIIVGQILPIEVIKNISDYIANRLSLINSPEYLVVINSHIAIKIEQYLKISVELEQYEIAENLKKLIVTFNSFPL